MKLAPALFAMSAVSASIGGGAYYFDQHLSEKNRIINPILSEAVLVKSTCGSRVDGKISRPFLNLEYKYAVKNLNSNDTYFYKASTGAFFDSNQACEKEDIEKKNRHQSRNIWYELTEPEKARFSLEEKKSYIFLLIFFPFALILTVAGVFSSKRRAH
jgi:hypothetical protein